MREEKVEEEAPVIKAAREQRGKDQEANLCKFETSVGAKYIGKCARVLCERYSKNVVNNKKYYRIECSNNVHPLTQQNHYFIHH